MTSSQVTKSKIECTDGIPQCSNTNLDEADCEEEMFEGKGGAFVRCSQKCDGVCDDKFCEDEAECNGYFYGVYCEPDETGRVKYVPPWNVCDGHRDCGDGELGDGELGNDEKSCVSDRHCRMSEELAKKQEVEVSMIPIVDAASCSPGVKRYDAFQPYCDKYEDQMNCTDPSVAATSCLVNGYPTTISRFMICHGIDGLKMCDDGFENLCVEVSVSCTVHKHQVCDGVPDCNGGFDENLLICDSTQMIPSTCNRTFMQHHRTLMQHSRTFTEQNQTCMQQNRDFIQHKGGGFNETGLPLSWIGDGVADCVGGIDEMEELWKTCGKDQTLRFTKDNSNCQEVYICDQENFVELEYLCDGIETCGNENRVCLAARDNLNVFSSVLYVRDYFTKYLGYCVPGMERFQLPPNLCVQENFDFFNVDVFGADGVMSLNIPHKLVDCRNMYGEVYLFTSCTGRCKNSSCPLSTPLTFDSCHGQFPDRVYTLAGTDSLTFLVKHQRKYQNYYFPCANQKCVDYRDVCNLVDDCGDGSDEAGCGNSFKCKSSGKFIALPQKCDGKTDCSDLSDECNDSCGKEIIEGTWLKVASWTIGGLAVVFNLIILNKNARDIALKKSGSFLLLLNKLLVTLVSIGDLLVGAYLLTISIVDVVYSTQFCQIQNKWLSGTLCSIIGVVSTFGSQTALFAMTALSICRSVGVYNSNKMVPPLPVSRRTVLLCVVICTFLVGTALMIAMSPLLFAFEDFFVNSIWYGQENPLFVGLPDKTIHYNVFEQYYGRMRIDNEFFLRWSLITKLTDNIFSRDHSGLPFKKVGFYGNDGVCLFKYFVHRNDPQRKFVWSILILNFSCFVTITIAYVFINAISRQSSRSVEVQVQNQTNNIKNRRVQRKVAMIIATDFICWVPFVLACALHYFEVMNATPWYSFSSIIVLPINSVINPLLYDHTLSLYATRCCRRTKAITLSLVQDHELNLNQNEVENPL